MSKAHRGTIHLEDGRLLATQEFAGEQYILRIEAPKCAATVRSSAWRDSEPAGCHAFKEMWTIDSELTGMPCAPPR